MVPPDQNHDAGRPRLFATDVPSTAVLAQQTAAPLLPTRGIKRVGAILGRLGYMSPENSR